jgi:hypothetical protein
MATIKVIAKIGDTIHPRLGTLVKGEEYEIDETEFGDEIFELPKKASIPPRRRGDTESVKE